MKRASSLRRLDDSLARRRGGPPVEGASSYETVNEQIALVRGRPAGAPSRGLLFLEGRLLRPVGRRTTAVRRLDTGQPRSAESTAAASPERPVAREDTARSFSGYGIGARPWEPPVLSGHFQVEPFEEQMPAASSRLSLAPAPPPSASARSVDPLPPRRKPVQGAASDSSRGVLSAEQEAATAAFAQEMAGLLEGGARAEAPEDARWNARMGQVTAAPGIVPAGKAAANPPPVAPISGHEVFDQMAAAMRYANSFDLGAVDLDARLDAIERDLPRRAAPGAPSAAVVDAGALSTFDVMADLAEIGTEEVAAPGATPSPTATEPGIAPGGSHSSEEKSHV